MEVIRVRAHELSETPTGGTAEESWLSAERNASKSRAINVSIR